MKFLSGTDRQKTYILALVGVLFAFGFAWLINQNEVLFRISDFLSGWWPMEKLLTEGRNIYDLQNGAEVAEFAGLGAGPLWNNFFYPAHYLVVLLPFALIPYRLAHFLWTAMGLLAFFAGSWLLIREVKWPKTLNAATLFMVMATLFVPTLQHTLWSQFNTVGLLAFALALWSIGNGRLWQAGMWARLNGLGNCPGVFNYVRDRLVFAPLRREMSGLKSRLHLFGVQAKQRLVGLGHPGVSVGDATF